MRTAVYDLIENGALVYTGRTINPPARLRYHTLRGKCSKRAEIRVVRWYDTPAKAMMAEARRIKRLCPPRNISLGNPKGALPALQAKAVWLGADPYARDAAVLAKMPGWTREMAKGRFGRRAFCVGGQLLQASAYRRLGKRKLAKGRPRKDEKPKP